MIIRTIATFFMFSTLLFGCGNSAELVDTFKKSVEDYCTCTKRVASALSEEMVKKGLSQLEKDECTKETAAIKSSKKAIEDRGGDAYQAASDLQHSCFTLLSDAYNQAYDTYNK